MPLRVTNIRLPVDAPEGRLQEALERRLQIAADEIVGWRILRKSLDARSRKSLQFVYSAVVDVPDEAVRLDRLRDDDGVVQFVSKKFDDPSSGKDPLDERPVVVGSGPAGLLAAAYLAMKGYRPLLIERGPAVKQRVRSIRDFDRGGEFDRENNYLFGEGGAGCFSDGKLTCRISGPDVDWVLERFVEFSCRLEKLDVVDGQVQGVATSSGYIRTSQVVLGIGHSARDTYDMLHQLGVPMHQKAFQLGLRIEQPQEQVDRHVYGRQNYLDLLGAADYSLVAKGQRDLFTFCMCAGGLIIPSISEPNMFCSNGMSSSRHDTQFANSGLVVTLEPEEFGSSHPLAGVELQRQYEAAAFRLAGGNYECPIQTAGDFLAGRAADTNATIASSYQRGTRPVNLEEVIPPSIIGAIRAGLPVMDEKWRGDFLKNAILVGPEMRGSSPVRIDRDRETRQTPGFAGLYPVGEGAGYAGGIVTAAVDGLRSAREIVRRFAPMG